MNLRPAEATNSREPSLPRVGTWDGGSGRLAQTKLNRGVLGRPVRVPNTRGLGIMKITIIVTAGLLAMMSVAAAADLPRKEPPPVAAAPIGKYPIGKYPVGKFPVGKYPQPVVTKG